MSTQKNASWKSGSNGTSSSSSTSSSTIRDNDEIQLLKQEIAHLRQELKQSNNEKNLLEFKNQLLLDMLTISSLDVKYFEDLEKAWNKKQQQVAYQQQQQQQQQLQQYQNDPKFQ
eukprot:gene6663-8242_t